MLVVDDIPLYLKSIALRGRIVLKNAGLEIDDADRVSIDINTYSWELPGEIKIDRARKVTILHQSETHQLNSAARHPSTLLQLAGIKLYPQRHHLAEQAAYRPPLRADSPWARNNNRVHSRKTRFTQRQRTDAKFFQPGRNARASLC